MSPWAKDLREMHAKFGFFPIVEAMTPADLRRHLEFRATMTREEQGELETAIAREDAEGVVDSLVDLLVFAVGTLDLFGIDADEAWRRVMEANRAKVPGTKVERPNPFGFPDLLKPEGWTPPTHAGNHGLLTKAFDLESGDRVEIAAPLR